MRHICATEEGCYSLRSPLGRAGWLVGVSLTSHHRTCSHLHIHTCWLLGHPLFTKKHRAKKSRNPVRGFLLALKKACNSGLSSASCPVCSEQGRARTPPSTPRGTSSGLGAGYASGVCARGSGHAQARSIHLLCLQTRRANRTSGAALLAAVSELRGSPAAASRLSVLIVAAGSAESSQWLTVLISTAPRSRCRRATGGRSCDRSAPCRARVGGWRLASEWESRSGFCRAAAAAAVQLTRGCIPCISPAPSRLLDITHRVSECLIQPEGRWRRYPWYLLDTA